ncbi:MAG: hypothetical protein JNG86_08295 [Verrucomicrobiaceae bacterium]|nr:hypothetical protein [Verrucomicrobiaceae bacterium]
MKLLFCLLTALALSFPARAQTPKPELISPQVKTAVDKAVAWLIKQQKSAGFIVDEKTDAKPKRGDLPSHSAAMTALALMGLASVGHMPDDPTPEGQAAGKALRFVVEGIEPDENGYLGRSDRSRMYGHGIISLMLAEMVGHAPDDATDKRLRGLLEGAVKLIIRSQQVPKSEANRGGWRYEPQSSDSDISVSVWQLMALRAAKNAGFDVPKDAIDNAVAYIKRSYRVERDSNGNPKSDNAAFSYEPYGGRQTFSTTAAGLLSLQVCGQYDAPEVIGSAKWLLKSPPEINEPWFFYGCYYYAQGMYQRGGDLAATARQHTEKTLVGAQSAEGNWFPRNGNEKSAGAVYATSLALLSLSVHHHYLPIYQK